MILVENIGSTKETEYIHTKKEHESTVSSDKLAFPKWKKTFFCNGSHVLINIYSNKLHFYGVTSFFSFSKHTEMEN